jgi:hypothetical protein
MSYYISWIGRTTKGNVYLIPISNASINLEAAKKEVQRIIETYGKEVVSIWIDEYDNNCHKIATLNHQVLIDALGQYIGVSNGS